MIDLREYDGFGKLIQVFRDGEQTLYRYRPDGLRHSKATGIAHRSRANDQTTTHLWDGGNIAVDLGGNGVKAKYLRGVGLLCQEVDGGDYFYLFNAHGDVVQRIGQDGNAAPEYVYDAFGNQKRDALGAVDTDPNPFRYCGEYFDKETQEIYLRNRSYNPRIGRFGTEDPARDGLNWYTYCAGNPMRYIDPLGLANEVAYQSPNSRAANLLYGDSVNFSITNPWGADNSSLGLGWHRGVDFVAGMGTNVHSITHGEVVYAKNDIPYYNPANGVYSMLVVRTYDPMNPGNDVYVKYLHLNIDENIRKQWEEKGLYTLTLGNVIGREDTIGLGGTHTHIEISKNFVVKNGISRAANNNRNSGDKTEDSTPYFKYWADEGTPNRNYNPSVGGGRASTSGNSRPGFSRGPSCDDIAMDVIRGNWGNGQERKDRLAAAGYDYRTVQSRVNQLLR